jgi:isoleucyl-tRNA synthetase
MPFAQWGAPHLNNEEFERSYPAQYICEAIDQTRGWFYTLMAIGTLVFDKSSYENVLCLGHILDAQGRKMSKHLGNVIEPIPLMERHGADAVRWYMLAAGSPWSARRIGDEMIEEVVRKVLLTYWNTASFFVLYANASNYDASTPAPEPADRPVTDRWLLSELHSCVRNVDAALETFDSAGAGRRLATFVDDLSNWYVRRSRRRFWDGDVAALATLHEALETLTRLLAPFVPFITDKVWESIRLAGSADSVHLASWPEANPALIDERLHTDMALVRRLVELGRSARAESKVRTRQPLGRALIGAAGWEALPEELRAQVADELNVVTLQPLSTVGSELVDTQVKPNFRALGKRFGSDTPKVAAAIAALTTVPPPGGTADIWVDGERVSIDRDELVVTETPREGWAVASDGGETVALDLELTEELRRAGLAREVVRFVQEARKASGLEVTDRIELWWEATSHDVAAAIRGAAGAIAGEVLAPCFAEGHPNADINAHQEEELGLTVWLRAAGN